MSKKKSNSKGWIVFAVILVIAFWYLVAENDDKPLFYKDKFRILASTSTKVMEDNL